MKRADFLRIIGAGDDVEYAPVAGMLSCGYGFAGYFNGRLNDDLDDTCILVNVRLVDLRESADEAVGRPRISDFTEFVEEIVRLTYDEDAPEPPAPEEVPADDGDDRVALSAHHTAHSDVYGKSIPLAAIPFWQMSVVYPVAHIGKMMDDLRRERKHLPSFLDLDNKSIILRFLRKRLW